MIGCCHARSIAAMKVYRSTLGQTDSCQCRRAVGASSSETAKERAPICANTNSFCSRRNLHECICCVPIGGLQVFVVLASKYTWPCPHAAATPWQDETLLLERIWLDHDTQTHAHTTLTIMGAKTQSWRHIHASIHPSITCRMNDVVFVVVVATK